MCGISGARATGGLSPGIVSAALDCIAHRGPDSSGMAFSKSCAIGIRRLAIIDVTGGDQPIHNETGNCSVVLNGEIYNYRELRSQLQQRGHHLRTQSDTEVLVHLYEDYGTEMCKALRGMFAFAILDHRNDTLFIARDRLGKKPLYYYQSPNGGVYFSSELKGISSFVRALGLTLHLSDQAISDYLSFGYIPQPETIYRDVKALPPGSWMEIKDERILLEKYWSLPSSRSEQGSYDDATHHVRELVNESVGLRLRSDVPVGVFLSGGIDSTTIAWEAAQQIGRNLRSFAVSSGHIATDESAIATRTADRFGIPHTILHPSMNPVEAVLESVRIHDQPYADSSSIFMLAISREARKYVKVVLSGDGGDEIFAGYRRHLGARILGVLPRLPSFLADGLAWPLEACSSHRRTSLDFLARLTRGLGMDPESRYVAWTSNMMSERTKARTWTRDAQKPTTRLLGLPSTEKHSWGEQLLLLDTSISLLSDMLVKVDMASMAASIEARCPFLDHVLVEYAFSLPLHFLLKGFRLKALLKDAYHDILPEEVREAPKKGFEVPMGKWLASDLSEILKDTLLANNARLTSYLDRTILQKAAVGTLPRHMNRTGFTYALLVLELWLRQHGGI